MSLRCLFLVFQSALLTDRSCSSVCPPTKPQSLAAMWRLCAACSATRSRTSSGSNTSRSTAAQWGQTDSHISTFSRFVHVNLCTSYNTSWSLLHLTAGRGSTAARFYSLAFLVVVPWTFNIGPHRILKLAKRAYFILVLISMHPCVLMATLCHIKSVFIQRAH